MGLMVRKEEPLPQDTHLPGNARRRLDLYIDDIRLGDTPFAIDITVASPHSYPYNTQPHSRRSHTLQMREAEKRQK